MPLRLRIAALVLAAMLAVVAGQGCARSGAPAAANPGSVPLAPAPARPGPLAAAAAPPAPASPAPAAAAALSADERIRAGQLLQKLYVGSHGPLEVRDIGLESGVIRARVVPQSSSTGAFDVRITRDLRWLFPVAQEPAAVLQAAAADRAFGDCLRAKGLRVYGDPGQGQTQRQMAELGSHAQSVLRNCAASPAECVELGKTSLPVVQFATQRVASFVPRAVIAQWTGCPAPTSPPR